MGDASIKKQERDKLFYLINDYCRAADTAVVCGIIAAVCVAGLGATIAAPLALIFKTKAKKIEESMRFDENDVELPQDVAVRYRKAQKRLLISQKLVKISLWLFIGLIVTIISLPLLFIILDPIMIKITTGMAELFQSL